MRVFTLLCLFVLCSCATNVNLSYTTRSSNTFYPHVENTIVVKSNSKKPIEVLVNNGGTEIVPVKKDDSTYAVMVKIYKDQPSYLIIKQGKKVLKERIRINEIPALHIMFEAIGKTREMTAEKFMECRRINVHAAYFQYDSQFEVMPFEILVLGKNNTVNRFKSGENGILPNHLSVQSGDIVILAGVGIKILSTDEIIGIQDFVLKIK